MKIENVLNDAENLKIGFVINEKTNEVKIKGDFLTIMKLIGALQGLNNNSCIMDYQLDIDIKNVEGRRA